MKSLQDDLLRHEEGLKSRLGRLKPEFAYWMDGVPTDSGGHIWVRLYNVHGQIGVHIAYKTAEYGFSSIEDLRGAITKYFEGRAKYIEKKIYDEDVQDDSL